MRGAQGDRTLTYTHKQKKEEKKKKGKLHGKCAFFSHGCVIYVISRDGLLMDDRSIYAGLTPSTNYTLVTYGPLIALQIPVYYVGEDGNKKVKGPKNRIYDTQSSP